ncbi:hypothetical protein QTG54_010356 [Skeletonema marinoi]|uniref:MYND-type domain-containing protein n=1 Tax=Skeletonema marinoi TaxID=267567 RepID=A0AAD8Y5J2_9STRA|nr:hypothetical protein QTG54_010356 [Skeletonema marinoi]
MSSADEDIIIRRLKDYEALTTSAIEKKFHEYGFPNEKNHGLTGMMKNGIEIVKLQEEIKAQQQLIKNLENPSQFHEEEKGGITTQKNIRGKHYMTRVEQLKILYDLYDELFVTVEKGRMENVVYKHRELHPINKEVCTVCLEDVPITSVSCVQYFVCCGNFICFQCFQASCAGGQLRMTNCPCCREEIFVALEKVVRQVEQQAKRGRPWAQTQMGIYFLEGSSCSHGDVVHHKVDVREALKWFKLAAEQRHPDAIRNVAQLHLDMYGKVKEVEQCQIKARALMKEAADLGNLRAQRNYAMLCRLGQGGPVDKSEAAHYYTLAYSQKGLSFEKDEVSPLASNDLPDEVLHAGLFLGIYHYYGNGGFTKNLHIAKYYLEEHVKESEKQSSNVLPDAYMYLAACLMELHECTFGRNVPDYSVPGYSSVPRAMSLYRKSIKLGIGYPNEYSQHSKEVLESMVTQMSRFCGNCGVASKDTPEGKLKECGRCHSTWYCGKECQTEHWKAGHKSDCVRQQV